MMYNNFIVEGRKVINLDTQSKLAETLDGPECSLPFNYFKNQKRPAKWDPLSNRGL
jgi:hypothetical protein